jgi:integrase
VQRIWHAPPKPSDEQREYSETAKEYLDWGNAQGGLNGRGWSSCHSKKRKAFLEYWQDELKVKVLSDLECVLPRVERVLRRFKNEGKTGKTILNYVETLCAFCNWCVKREYLDRNPLKNLTSFDLTPKSYRRALTVKEIEMLLCHCSLKRRLLYEVAIMTGLRANELAHLKVSDIDTEDGGLISHAEWTKNRKDGFQPAPQGILTELIDASKNTSQDKYLLTVSSNPARELDVDLVKANIPKHTPEGKIDFHSLRVTYVSLIVESGATVKEAQTLARRATPDLTINTYAKTSKEKLKNVAEKLEKMEFFNEKYEHSMNIENKPPAQENITPLEINELYEKMMNGEGGIRTPGTSITGTTV